MELFLSVVFPGKRLHKTSELGQTIKLSTRRIHTSNYPNHLRNGSSQLLKFCSNYATVFDAAKIQWTVKRKIDVTAKCTTPNHLSASSNHPTLIPSDPKMHIPHRNQIMTTMTGLLRLLNVCTALLWKKKKWKKLDLFILCNISDNCQSTETNVDISMGDKWENLNVNYNDDDSIKFVKCSMFSNAYVT